MTLDQAKVSQVDTTHKRPNLQTSPESELLLSGRQLRESRDRMQTRNTDLQGEYLAHNSSPEHMINSNTL